MARYLYEDFRVTFTPRTDGAYDVVALESSGIETAGRFDPPLTDDELRAAVLGVIETTRARAGTRKAAPGRAARDVGDGSPPAFDSERLGGALASALLSGPVGAAYDRASAAARSRDQGIRLTLSLAGAPALLPDGAQLSGASIAQLDDAAADFQLPDGPIVSLTPGELGGDVVALVDRVVGGDTEPGLLALLDTTTDGLALTGATTLPGVVDALGEVQAIAL
ncbi:MAG: hypothetical protein M3487_03985 [Actinomycetota bacterium]|nr:hypothetical protein [Actinomycetota bacterium]